MLLTLLGVAFVTAIVFIWRYLNNINKYWEERGIPYKKPLPFFGNSWELFSRKKGIIKLHEDHYKLFPEDKLYGFYDFMKPYLVVKDIELVERVIIKDFQHFVDRGFGSADKTTDPINVNLTNMTGKRWKVMRNKFAPMFTTGKLKHMIPQIRNLSESLVSHLEKADSEIEIKDLFQRFSMDVIASCAFGITINALEEGSEESEFRRMGKLAFNFSTSQFLRFLIITCFPALAKRLRVSQNDPAVAKYFGRIIRETLAYRKENNLSRNDFVQLMLTLQEKGSIEFEGDENDEYLKMGSEEQVGKQKETIEMNDDVMVGQAFVFLVAGFDATATVLMWLFYDLAMHPDKQEKVREEIMSVMKTRGGEMDYDALKQMTYFNQCVQETTRLHSFVPSLFRICTKEYTFPGINLTIQPGQGVLIPVSGIHHDPELYPDPDEFKPERFAPDVQRPNCAYLPFGDGPRMCIAMRFALAEVKLCGAKILQNFKIELSPNTKHPIEFDVKTFNGMPKDPLLFKVTKIN